MKIINLGIMAHIDAGKTTVTESFLYHSGIKPSMGNVDEGTTTTDSMELEKKRGMTIRSATVSFMIKNTKINLIDTPGHMDFIAEVERSLSVLDGVILVVSAKEGVQPQTRAIFRKLQQMSIPTIIFINKIDRSGVNLDNIYSQISCELTSKFILMQKVIYNETIDNRTFSIEDKCLSDNNFKEQLLDLSDDLLEKYLKDEEITAISCEDAIRNGVNSCSFYPIYHGTALKDYGIEQLMEAVDMWFVPKPYEKNELSAYVYKVQSTSYKHNLSYIRVFSGYLTLRMRTSVWDGCEKLIIRNLFGLKNGAIVHTDSIGPGDVGIIMDCDELKCGSWIGYKTHLYKLTQTEPLLNVGIEPIPPAQRRQLLEALNMLAMEDPYLDLTINDETEEISLKLFGNLQKEIIHSLIKERHGLDCKFDSIRTIRKVKPKHTVTCIVPINSKGNLLRAGVGLTLEPLDKSSGIQYETMIPLGDLPKSFQNGVREGVEKGIRNSINGEVVDTRVTFMYFDYDSVTSTPSDYRRLAEKVVYQALKEAGTISMEPVMEYTLTAPLGFEKRIIGELVAIGAEIEGSIYTESEMQIVGKVPLDSCKDFPAYLLTITEGRGIFETCFYEYRQVE